MDPRSTPPHPGGVDPRPEPVRVELDRIESRWRTLPLPQARAGMPRMRLTLDRLAEVTGGPAWTISVPPRRCTN
jgi:hypothetical protein